MPRCTYLHPTWPVGPLPEADRPESVLFQQEAIVRWTRAQRGSHKGALPLPVFASPRLCLWEKIVARFGPSARVAYENSIENASVRSSIKWKICKWKERHQGICEVLATPCAFVSALHIQSDSPAYLERVFILFFRLWLLFRFVHGIFRPDRCSMSCVEEFPRHIQIRPARSTPPGGSINLCEQFSF